MGERKTLFEGKGRRVTGLSPAKIGYMNRSLTRFSKNFESKCSFPSNSIRSMINFCPCMRSVEPLEWGSKRERLHGKLISLKLYRDTCPISTSIVELFGAYNFCDNYTLIFS